MNPAILVAGLALASCVPLDTATDVAAALPQVGDVVGPPEPPATIHGIDIVEIVTYALAALGLGPVARILLAAKPILTPVLRVLLGKAKAAPAPAPEEPKA